MTRRKTPPRVITDRTTSDRYDAPRRHLERGDEVTVDGIRGRCAFVAYTRHHETGADWVDVITSRGFSRTIRPDMIKTVHRSRTLGVAAASR